VLSNRYAAASSRSDGMLLLCGGRDASGMVRTSFFFFIMSGYSPNRVRHCKSYAKFQLIFTSEDKIYVELT
jgi:hypothetical protein